MPCCVKLGRPLRTFAVPLLLSLVLHGLLGLVLWCWPVRTAAPPLSIESTRIVVDTCVLEARAATLLPEGELPWELREPDVHTILAPQILNVPPMHTATASSPAPSATPPAVGASGSNSANGGARGEASGAGLFPHAATAASVVFVLDHSVSMGTDGKLDFARQELIASLRRLPAGGRFQVIAYNDLAVPFLVDGRSGLLSAEPATIEKVISLLLALRPGGGSNHLAALRYGLDLRPDVLYFLTDAGDLKAEEVDAISQRNRGTVIHTIELTHRLVSQSEGPLARLAGDNHGTYRRVALSLRN